MFEIYPLNDYDLEYIVQNNEVNNTELINIFINYGPILIGFFYVLSILI